MSLGAEALLFAVIPSEAFLLIVIPTERATRASGGTCGLGSSALTATHQNPRRVNHDRLRRLDTLVGPRGGSVTQLLT